MCAKVRVRRREGSKDIAWQMCTGFSGTKMTWEKKYETKKWIHTNRNEEEWMEMCIKLWYLHTTNRKQQQQQQKLSNCCFVCFCACLFFVCTERFRFNSRLQLNYFKWIVRIDINFIERLFFFFISMNAIWNIKCKKREPELTNKQTNEWTNE